MSIIDDLVAQYAGVGGPQIPANSLLANMQAAQYRPAPAATFPNAPPSAPPPSGSLPIPPADPPIWLGPDGSVSYTGRQPAASDAAQPNNNPLGNNALTLMALGAGIAQGGVGKGLQFATTAAEADRKQQAQRYGVLHAYDALTDAGVPRDEARAAIYDPHVMRAVAAKYFGPKGRAVETATPSPPSPAVPQAAVPTIAPGLTGSASS
jgi:hypothetical protein